VGFGRFWKTGFRITGRITGHRRSDGAGYEFAHVAIKAERFIETALREWAFATAFETSEQRKAELPIRLHHYNWHRPHASLGKKPPISRIRVNANNLLQLHS
jgi:transposase InsO family protein